jgi:hypothetical protein
MIDHSNFLDFVELVWDGNQKHVRDIDTNQHHIWASSTLYNEEQKLMRQQWFSDFLRNKEELSYKEIIDFHTGSYVKDTSYDIVMERPEIKLKTVSVSQINITQREKSFFYLDTLANRTEKLNLELCKPV